MSEKLKPCPFCGSENASWDEYEECVVCEGEDGCYALGPARFDTKKEAITAWNRRNDKES